jgi:hypothetical protein
LYKKASFRSILRLPTERSFFYEFQKPKEPDQEPKERLQEPAEPAKSKSAEQEQNAKRKEQGTALRFLKHPSPPPA